MICGCSINNNFYAIVHIVILYNYFIILYSSYFIYPFNHFREDISNFATLNSRWNKIIVLYCIVLYCIVLYWIVLYCIVLYCIRRKAITLLPFTSFWRSYVVMYPASSWFLLRQKGEKPLRATVCFSIEHARVRHAPRDAFDVNFICHFFFA